MKLINLIFLIFFISFMSCKKEGCMDANATNYNSEAKVSDGSCYYSNTPTSLIIQATIQVESVCGDANTRVTHNVTCSTADTINAYIEANGGGSNPCIWVEFIAQNGQSITGYYRSSISC